MYMQNNNNFIYINIKFLFFIGSINHIHMLFLK